MSEAGKTEGVEQAPVVLEVPERPSVAPDVEFIGEMKESGFEEPQWLVKRGGRFIQLTELLYRVAEQANGERTHEEMAEGATGSTDWLVNADNVRQLLEARLLPMGLVIPANAEGAAMLEAARESRQRSPLAVKLRTNLIGPRVIDPVTGVLQFLFAPVLLIPILAAIVLAHGWMYFAHGVGGAINSVIYNPSLTLAVLAILFVSGAVHEFGHASALRYGGGMARGMGAGIYLVYPALYTDTTDSYRLGRWGKVRTDLGGFYFHLICALGLVAAYFATGWEFLLFAALLINMDILFQCMPFVRFDGYWTLADLTGIPDFFSQMGAFLKSEIPLPRWRDAALPNLKPWVKSVFAAYILVTVPVLLLLVAYLITTLPNILATLWDSVLRQTEAFSTAANGGDFLAGGAAVLQILILALQALGIGYLLYSLGGLISKAMWKWSKPTPARRMVGILAAAAAVSLLAFIWLS